jgi:lysophospholipase L1-like esterase
VVAKRLALVTLGLVVVFAAIEIACRLKFSSAEITRFISSPEPIEATRLVDHPFFPFVGRPSTNYELDVPIGVHVGVSNNAYGFRSHELPTSKTPSDYFILAFGESTTWGDGAETNAATWPEVLEARLRARYPSRNVRVFNFGTQNATLPYSVVALALIGVHIQPDLVIVYRGFNELGPATARGYRYDHSHFFRNLSLGIQWQGFQRSIPRAFLASYAIAYLTGLADSAIGADNLSFYVQHPLEFDPSMDEEGVKRALTREWEHLLTVDAIARGYDAGTLFSTFQYYDGKDRLYRVVNDTLRTFFEKHRVAYVDPDALIPDFDRSLQFDACHFTRAGDELMAQNFFKKIVVDRLLER